MTEQYDTISDILHGAESDGGRLTGRPLAGWLARHRDNDVKVYIHNVAVPIGAAHYCDLADSIILHLVDGEDLREATSFCPAGSPELIDALEELVNRWRSENPIGRAGKTPGIEALLLWLAANE